MTTTYWQVYVHTYGLVTVHVAAPNADVALGRVRERMAVDTLPSHYRTVSQPTKVGEWERKQSGAEDYAEVDRGRRLTADEISYCKGRGYETGYDIDAFPGLQWSHLVDDGVALCRTTALWGAAGSPDDKTRVSCPFCLDVLHREMRYEHLDLHVDWRRRGAHAVAAVTYDSDVACLRVNGVSVQRVVRDTSLGPNDPDKAFEAAYHEMQGLSDQINDAQAAQRPAAPPVPQLRKDSAYRCAAYIAKRSALGSDDGHLSAEQRERLSGQIAALHSEMTEAERVDVDAYFLREDD
jgi:hypothetical protein